MIKNYVLTAMRIMARQRGFSLINVAGLSVGITCSLLLILYIEDELNYDRFHPDADRMYRIGFQGKLQGNEFNLAETGAPLSKTLQRDIPVIESTIRIANWPTFPVRYEDKTFTEPYLLLADSNFFSFFRFDLVSGNPNDVLRGKDKLVISESAAKRYFDYKGVGDHSPIGKKVTLAQGYVVEVSGIARNAPTNSHFHYTLILSADSWPELRTGRWTHPLVNTYIKLKPGRNIEEVERRFSELIDVNFSPELKEIYQADLSEMKAQDNYFSFFTQPIKDIHLKSNLSDEIEPTGSLQYIQLFAIIALFIIILACINFVNLSTARSASRAKEVGVRKTIGAGNSRLIFQFLFESYLYTIIAVLLSIGLIALCLMPFNLIVGKNLTVLSFFQPYFLGGIGLFILMVGLLSGSYPAFFLTYFSPAQILKGNLRTGVTSHRIRNILVVFQFFISLALIISTIVIYQQLRHIQKMETGFDKTNLITLLHTANLKENAGAFKKELLNQTGIEGAGFTNRMPPFLDWQSVFRIKGEEKDFLMTVYETDNDHLKAMGYSLAEGRFFDAALPSDSLTILLNETAAKSLGITKVTDQILTSTYDSSPRVERKLIGIVKDFNFHSLKESVQPLVIVPGRQPNLEMVIRISGEDVPQVINHIKSLWEKYAPDAPFEYSFVEDNFKNAYDSEEKITEVFFTFTLIAILIASLGLLGLATYTAEQRSKEIGIRKVMGATVWGIIVLIAKDFTKVVIIAFAFASPLSWWAMDQWLEQYPYRIEIEWWVFGISCLIAFSVAFITVSSQALKAALSNPIKSLRNE